MSIALETEIQFWIDICVFSLNHYLNLCISDMKLYGWAERGTASLDGPLIINIWIVPTDSKGFVEAIDWLRAVGCVLSFFRHVLGMMCFLFQCDAS